VFYNGRNQKKTPHIISMVPVFLKMPFLDMASSVWAMPEEQWIDDSATKEDIEMLKKEATGDSMIDKVNFRQQVLDMWSSKAVDLFVKELPGRTRVVFLGTQEQFQGIKWPLWARIFQAIGHPIGRILFYGHPSERYFAKPGETFGPENVNGGYTNLCSQERIVIYRYEEATRVLLHELLHTACFDKEKGVEDLEANTEAWTELFLCALLSKGKSGAFSNMWLRQCMWIQGQCQILEEGGTVNGPHDYAWRYINGKRDILYGLGFLKKCNGALPVRLTPRFTTPEWPI
jgi:hypothetical protein